MDNPVKVILPYPVSVNRVWGHTSTHVYLNPKAIAYRKEVWAIMHRVKFGRAPLKIEILLYPPRKSCDIDNILKCLLDTFQKIGVIDNDNQVRKLYIEKKEVVKGGRLEVVLSKLDILEEIVEHFRGTSCINKSQ